MSHPQIIYRLLSAEAWQQAQLAGSFFGTEHDIRDGFIHFSTAEQVAETAVRYYAGQAALLLLGVSVPALGEALRWEPSRGGALFPHLYGALPVSAVTRIDELALGEDGKHLYPSDLA